MPVALVTDSTAYLPRDLIEQYSVTVVPLQVLIAGKAYDEDEISSGELATALRGRTPVTTSRPAAQAFSTTYARLAEAGFDAVVSVHLSGEMSGTWSAAVQAARTSSLSVEVVDSRSLGMGLGFAVVAAGEVIAAGGSVSDAARAAVARAANTTACFYVEDPEHLRRGGRIGAAAALVGTALAIKPLLRLDDGRIVPIENVRTSTRALARLEEIVVGLAGRERPGTVPAPIDLVVHHLDAGERAEALCDALAARIPGVRQRLVVEVGAVVGAHVGPGLLAVILAPA